jgi:serine phosphatase RsbU (regulator of sigma subunit)
MQSSVYTLVLDQESQSFQFGVASSENPFFRHNYNNVPEILKNQYATGGTIPCYSDEHGIWLSAFAPIYNKSGVTVAVVQADLRFDEFKSLLQAQLIKEVIAILIILAFSLFVMYRFIDKILQRENKSREIIEAQNFEINQSIDYAKVILESAMNMQDSLTKFFPNSYIMFKPKDKVGGDFYFFCPLPDENPVTPSKFYVGVFDCTGHGIPGAILSMLGLTSLSQIVHQHKGIKPDEVLKKLSKRIMYMLNQKDNGQGVQDGMEGCLCLVDMNAMRIELSSSYRKVLYIKKSNQDQLDEIKGDRIPIGGLHHGFNREFTLHNLEFEFGDKIILSTDGIVDQHSINGERTMKLTQKRLTEYFNQINTADFKQSCTQFGEYFEQWKGDLEQTDDATLMAVELLPYSAINSKAA